MTGPNKIILLVDEPTYGQDMKNAILIMNALEQLCKEGMSCIFTCHDQRLVRQYAHFRRGPLPGRIMVVQIDNRVFWLQTQEAWRNHIPHVERVAIFAHLFQQRPKMGVVYGGFMAS